MKYYQLSKDEMHVIFNRDVENDVNFPSPADACFINFLQSMSPKDRQSWLKQQRNENSLLNNERI